VATHRERVLSVLRLSDEPLDDDELAQRTGIRPRQAVNQVCRALKREGTLSRVPGQRGKIANILNESAGQHGTYKSVTVDRVESNKSGKQQTAHQGVLADIDPASSLIILTCSGAKKTGGSVEPMSVTEWPESLYQARSALHARLHVDHGRLLPAGQRYFGHFYKAAHSALMRAVSDRAHVLIVSGGYGVVRAEEKIGYYDKQFRRSEWPRGLVEQLIIDEAHRVNAQAVVAFASTTSEYATLVRRIRWHAGGIDTAFLVTRQPSRDGAMVKSPRALGEAFTAFWNRDIGQLPAGVVIESLT
jgi:hypothetical protein